MRRTGVLASTTLSALAAAIVPTFKADFHDIARSSGLTDTNVYGGLNRKDYILETTGNGVAIFDYDGDGRNDVFIANGTRLNGSAGQGAPLPQVYHNEGNGRFKNVAANLHTGIGAYRITFKDKVDRCRYVVTMTDDFGFVRVLRYKSDQRALVVETANTSGAPADRSFYLQVIC